MASSTTHYVLVLLLVAFAIVQAWPQNQNIKKNRRPGPPRNSFGDERNSFGEERVGQSPDDFDNVPSATGHHGHHNGRVQIKVYRGQSKGHGWDSFAPYGYWVRQPPDNHGHHHGGY